MVGVSSNDEETYRLLFRSLLMREIIAALGYMSPNGNNLANPELVARQIQGLRHAMIRIRKNQFAGKSSSNLQVKEK
jgi:hypothetical protein